MLNVTAFECCEGHASDLKSRGNMNIKPGNQKTLFFDPVTKRISILYLNDGAHYKSGYFADMGDSSAVRKLRK